MEIQTNVYIDVPIFAKQEQNKHTPKTDGSVLQELDRLWRVVLTLGHRHVFHTQNSNVKF